MMEDDEMMEEEMVRGESEYNMEEDDVALKVPQLKRKPKGSGGSSQARMWQTT